MFVLFLVIMAGLFFLSFSIYLAGQPLRQSPEAEQYAPGDGPFEVPPFVTIYYPSNWPTGRPTPSGVQDQPLNMPFMGVKLGEFKEEQQPYESFLSVILRIFLRK